MKNTFLLILVLLSLQGFAKAPDRDTSVPFSSIPIYYGSNHDSDRIVGLVSLGNGLWANKTFWNIDLKKDRLRIADTSAMLSALWSAINNRQATFTLTTTGNSGAATFNNGILNIPQYSGGGGGTQYNLNNEVYYGLKWVSGQTFTMPSTPTKFYYVQVYNSSNPMNNPYASYTWTSGTSVTVNDAMQSGDSIVFHYDAGTANGKVAVTDINATGTPSASTVLYGNGTWGAVAGGGSTDTTALHAEIVQLTNAKQDLLTSGTNIKTINGASILGSGNITVGGGSGIASIILHNSGVLHVATVNGANDGSGNWTLTDTLVNQSPYTILRRASGTGTPSFGSIDSNYFAGNFGAQVSAAQKYVVDTTSKTTVSTTYTGAWQPWVKPKGIATVMITAAGGGGAGGAGYSAASGTLRGGGGGGASGTISKIVLPAYVLPDTLWYFIGAGGAGGSGAGGAGGSTYVSIQSGQTATNYLILQGFAGNGGAAGTSSAGGSGGTSGNFSPTAYGNYLGNLVGLAGIVGNAGSTSGSTTVNAVGSALMQGCGGAGVNTDDIGKIGTAYAFSSIWESSYNAAGGTAGGGNGQNGVWVLRPMLFATGGTGGGSNGTGAGGNGGNGAFGTGGGGGGGGVTGGTGGNGGNGFIIINCW